jgi:hypothetical protein
MLFKMFCLLFVFLKISLCLGKGKPKTNYQAFRLFMFFCSNPGVPPKLMKKELLNIIKATGVIAIKPAHLMSMEQVI